MPPDSWYWNVDGCKLVPPATCEHQKGLPIAVEKTQDADRGRNLVRTCGGTYGGACDYRALKRYTLAVNKDTADESSGP